jgi:hypothetical protein
MVDLQSLEDLSERKHGKAKTKIFRHDLFENFPVRDTQGWALKYSPPVIFGYRIQTGFSEDLVSFRNPEIGFYRLCSADIVLIMSAFTRPSIPPSETLPSNGNIPTYSPVRVLIVLTH